MLLRRGPSVTIVKADDPLVVDKMPGPKVFLGGLCKGRDWRQDFYTRFDRMEMTFISPRRETFIDPEMDPVGHATQVQWERQALDVCDIGVYWLGEGLSNQAGRVEMGYLLGLKKPLLVGAEKKFMGVEHLVGFSGLVVTNSMDGLINRYASLAASFQGA